MGYWRPWKEDSNVIDSYLDYVRDTSLVKYGADTIGQYINEASQGQIQAIGQLGQAIGRGMNVLSDQMAGFNDQLSDINNRLLFINRNLDIQVEQHRLTNLLLRDVSALLRVPDSEKERRQSIELGLKFLVNASKDADLYADALEQLLKAETIMRQDYFVLHRIGCIYMYAQRYIDPERALDYFLRAAKYASVESDARTIHLAIALTTEFSDASPELDNANSKIGLLAADSFEKAAFASYVLGRFSDAVNYQSKASRLNNTHRNAFILAKYQIRNGGIQEGIKNLGTAIDGDPIHAIAAFKEIDLINQPQVIDLIAEKNQEINNKINILIDEWKDIKSIESNKTIIELAKLLEDSYEIKITKFAFFTKKMNDIIAVIERNKNAIDDLINEVGQYRFLTHSPNKFINELTRTKDLPLEEMPPAVEGIVERFEKDRLKIGTKAFGGTVFHLDIPKGYGLVCTGPIGFAPWGVNGVIGTSEEFGSGLENTRKIVEKASTLVEAGGWFSKNKVTPIATAARLCLEYEHEGYTDWYLPSRSELEAAFDNLFSRDGDLCLGIFNFPDEVPIPDSNPKYFPREESRLWDNDLPEHYPNNPIFWSSSEKSSDDVPHELDPEYCYTNESHESRFDVHFYRNTIKEYYVFHRCFFIAIRKFLIPGVESNEA